MAPTISMNLLIKGFQKRVETIKTRLGALDEKLNEFASDGESDWAIDIIRKYAAKVRHSVTLLEAIGFWIQDIVIVSSLFLISDLLDGKKSIEEIAEIIRRREMTYSSALKAINSFVPPVLPSE